MSYLHRERLVGLLTYLNKNNNSFKAEFDGCGTPEVIRQNTTPNYIAYESRRILSPEAQDDLYNSPLPSETNLYLVEDNFIDNLSSSESESQVANAIGKTELLRYRNNGAMIRDWFDQSLGIYNAVNRYIGFDNGDGVRIYSTKTFRNTRYDEFGNITSDSTGETEDIDDNMSGLSTVNRIVRSFINGDYYTSQHYKTSIVINKAVYNPSGSNIGTYDPFFLDEIKFIFKDYDNLTFPPSTTYQASSYTASFNGTNESSSVSIPTPSDPSVPSGTTGTYTNTTQGQVNAFKLRSLTWQELMNHDPKPSTWL